MGAHRECRAGGECGARRNQQPRPHARYDEFIAAADDSPAANSLAG